MQSEVCFSDWPFWASTPFVLNFSNKWKPSFKKAPSSIPPSYSKEFKSVSRNKIIFNFTFSFPESSLISQRHSSRASEIWWYRTLLSHFSNLLTTPRLQTVGRPTERCLKTWVHLKPNLLYWWSNLLYWWSSVQIMYRSITFARRSSGIMNLAGQCSLRCVSVIDVLS